MNHAVVEKFFPECRAGGYSRVDGSVEFYQRINSIVSEDAVVLDIGAGRGVAHVDGSVSYTRRLMRFRGRCKKVIGIDVDDAVLGNPSLDEAHVIDKNTFPLPDSSVDIAFADWVLEHIEDVSAFSAEVERVIRPGGWFCARTPNKWGYISLASRLIPEALHARVLKRAQPNRKTEDVFPTFYRLNTRTNIARAFSADRWDVVTYTYDSEPAYFGSNTLLWRLALFMYRLTPPGMGSVVMLFARKREIVL